MLCRNLAKKWAVQDCGIVRCRTTTTSAPVDPAPEGSAGSDDAGEAFSWRGAGEAFILDGSGCSAGASYCSCLGGVLVELACLTNLGVLQVQLLLS